MIGAVRELDAGAKIRDVIEISASASGRAFGRTPTGVQAIYGTQVHA